MKNHVFGEKKCVGCDRIYSGYPALSRYGHGEICPKCGTQEALTGDFIGTKKVPTNENEISDEDRVEIARLVSEGFTSGVIDNESHRVWWSLEVDKF